MTIPTSDINFARKQIGMLADDKNVGRITGSKKGKGFEIAEKGQSTIEKKGWSYTPSETKPIIGKRLLQDRFYNILKDNQNNFNAEDLENIRKAAKNIGVSFDKVSDEDEPEAFVKKIIESIDNRIKGVAAEKIKPAAAPVLERKKNVVTKETKKASTSGWKMSNIITGVVAVLAGASLVRNWPAAGDTTGTGIAQRGPGGDLANTRSGGVASNTMQGYTDLDGHEIPSWMPENYQGLSLSIPENNSQALTMIHDVLTAVPTTTLTSSKNTFLSQNSDKMKTFIQLDEFDGWRAAREKVDRAKEKLEQLNQDNNRPADGDETSEKADYWRQEVGIAAQELNEAVGEMQAEAHDVLVKAQNLFDPPTGIFAGVTNFVKSWTESGAVKQGPQDPHERAVVIAQFLILTGQEDEEAAVLLGKGINIFNYKYGVDSDYSINYLSTLRDRTERITQALMLDSTISQERKKTIVDSLIKSAAPFQTYSGNFLPQFIRDWFPEQTSITTEQLLNEYDNYAYPGIEKKLRVQQEATEIVLNMLKYVANSASLSRDLQGYNIDEFQKEAVKLFKQEAGINMRLDELNAGVEHESEEDKLARQIASMKSDQELVSAGEIIDSLLNAPKDEYQPWLQEEKRKLGIRIVLDMIKRGITSNAESKRLIRMLNDENLPMADRASLWNAFTTRMEGYASVSKDSEGKTISSKILALPYLPVDTKIALVQAGLKIEDQKVQVQALDLARQLLAENRDIPDESGNLARYDAFFKMTPAQEQQVADIMYPFITR